MNLRGALLIIRAWVERDSSAPLRADIRLSKDLSSGFEQTTTVTSPEAGAEAVRIFLQDVVDADRREEDTDGDSAQEAPKETPPATGEQKK